MKKFYTVLLTLCSLLGFSQVQYGWHELSPQNSLPALPGEQITTMVSDSSGNIYVAGFKDTGGQYNVWEWNGVQWSRLGTNGGGYGQLFIDSGNVLYCGNARWNGHAWNTSIPPIGSVYCTDQLGQIYTASSYYSPNDTGSETSVSLWYERWQPNGEVPFYEVGAICVTQGTIYVATSGSDFATNDIRVSSLFAGNYSEVYFGGYQDSDLIGTAYTMINDTSGNYFYLGTSAGIFVFTGYYLNLLNPGVVNYLSSGSTPVSLWQDRSGALYASGYYDDDGYSYVAQYNDTAGWIELGAGNYKLPVKQAINAICGNNRGNVFAGGAFTDGNGKLYVAEYGPLQPGDIYTFLTASDANCNRNGSVTTLVYGGAEPYTYTWSNGSSSANLDSVANGSYSVTITDALGRFTIGSATVGNSCYARVSGIIFDDENDNCIYDNGVDKLLYDEMVTIITSNGTKYYGITGSDGSYTVEIPDTGIMQVIPDVYYGDCGAATRICTGSDSVDVATPGDTVNNVNIAMSGVTAFDLTLHPGWTSADPGFTKQYWVMPFNLSPVTVSGNVTVVFNYDSNLVYQNSLAPVPTVDEVNHTLTWVVSGSTVPYGSFDWNNERFVSNFLVPANLSPGYQLQSSFVVLPTTGDCDTANNYFNFSQAVTGSHDPNGKEVSPAGELTSDDSVLTYTIYYQNTGTDSTNFVIVKDTLSQYLNPTTVVNLASSDKYSAFNISGTGILTWTFNPLRIPDSTTNNAASKGFIIFSVKTKANLAQGANITNTATVYFDYNAGVQTNTTTSTVAAVTGVSSLPQRNIITVKAQPNPFSDLTQIVVNGLHQKFDFELYDVTGRLQIRIPSLQTNQFDVRGDELPAGIYLYRIVTGNQQVNGKLVKE